MVATDPLCENRADRPCGAQKLFGFHACGFVKKSKTLCAHDFQKASVMFQCILPLFAEENPDILKQLTLKTSAALAWHKKMSFTILFYDASKASRILCFWLRLITEVKQTEEQKAWSGISTMSVRDKSKSIIMDSLPRDLSQCCSHQIQCEKGSCAEWEVLKIWLFRKFWSNQEISLHCLTLIWKLWKSYSCNRQAQRERSLWASTQSVLGLICPDTGT